MDFARRKRKLALMVILFLLLMLYPIAYLTSLPARNPNWIMVGNIIKLISPNVYQNFKVKQKGHRLQWFEDLAQQDNIPLHAASGYGYMSEDEYNNMVDQVLQEMPIEKGDSIFELGCGVGADLKRIRNNYGETVAIGGSDLSENAILKIRELFPKDATQFHIISMTKKNERISDNSKDHVISVGAFAMYLYVDEMEMALKEAIRITKPGGHLCFTHFVEPNGIAKGSILEPIDKSFWKKIADRYPIQNLRVKQMVYYKDRYFVCFSKSKRFL